MGSLGVLFAIDDVTTERLLAAEDDEAVMEIVEAIEEAWELAEDTDKAWDAIHRALGDGSLEVGDGKGPLERAILGGKQLHEGDEYIVAFVSKQEVPAIAKALAAIDDAAMRERYHRLVPADYALEYGDEDCEYTVENFRGVAAFYARAAQAGRAVIFTVAE